VVICIQECCGYRWCILVNTLRSVSDIFLFTQTGLLVGASHSNWPCCGRKELSEILMTRFVTSRITAPSESFTLSLPIDNPRPFCLGLYSGKSDLTSQVILDLFLASMFTFWLTEMANYFYSFSLILGRGYCVDFNASTGPILQPPYMTDESILRNYGMITGR